MGKRYSERLRETRARSLSRNVALYLRRKVIGRPCGVLERVLTDQTRHIEDSSESDSCAGSRLDYGGY